MIFTDFIHSFPLTTLLLAAISIFYILVFGRSSRIKRMVKDIPGPTRWPVIGSALSVNVSNEELGKLQFHFAQTYGPRYMVVLGNNYYVSFSDGEDVKKLLESSVHIDKGDLYKFVMPWLGEGLLTSQGQKWYKRRKMLTGSFHFKILEDFLQVFNEQSQVLVEVLQTEFAEQRVGDICPYITRAALDIICGKCNKSLIWRLF